MQRCKKEHCFTLPTISPYLITKITNLNFVESAIFNSRCDFSGGFTTVKHFIKFLFEMKTSIEKVLGSDYKVEVYDTLDFMDEWSYDKHPLNFVGKYLRGPDQRTQQDFGFL